MSDIKGISLSFCTYKILMEEKFKPVIQPQQRLNLKVQDVVKNLIVRLLDSGLIYPISDSQWVSPIHVVQKKGGMTVVLNDKNELIPSRTVTGWRVCIDYRFFQIPEEQEKTTFTCPYGTFAYRRMSFGLCKEDFMEVFIDDFSVFSNSFDQCLNNLDKMLGRCKDAKSRIIKWVMLLQGFNIKIKDKKGAENLAADHLSRLENPNMGELAEEEIVDKFPDENLMILKAKLNDEEPCALVTVRKVYEAGFYWPSIFKDAKDYVCKVFDVWGLDFMGPFPDSRGRVLVTPGSVVVTPGSVIVTTGSVVVTTGSVVVTTGSVVE
ncbi:hypothetical protein Tco_0304051 [Tanacetum coccineum]